MAELNFYVPATVAHALHRLRDALLELPEEKTFLSDEYLYTLGLEAQRNEQAQLTTIALTNHQPLGQVLKGEVVEDPTEDPEGRALVTAILKRKENNS